MPAVPRYYYCTNGTDVLGPVTLGGLRALKNTGVITTDTHLCLDGTDVWEPISTLLGKEERKPMWEHPKPHREKGGRRWGTAAPPTDDDDTLKEEGGKMGCGGFLIACFIVGVILLLVAATDKRRYDTDNRTPAQKLWAEKVDSARKQQNR